MSAPTTRAGHRPDGGDPAANAAGSQAQAELVLNNILKSYSGVRALSGASLACRSGEVHGLIGENGAGKSTLVKVLSGAVNRDAGSITLDGHELHRLDPGSARARGIGTVFQELSLIGDLTVAQNLFYAAEPQVRFGRISRRATRVAANEALERFGVEQDVDRLVSELRLAERQILEIIKVLLREPRVLLLDEATSALLPAQVEWLFDVVREFAAQGGIAIFVSHRLAEITALCNRVTVFRNGHDVGGGLIDELPEAKLVELMLGRRMSNLYPPRPSLAGNTVQCRLRGISAPPTLTNFDLDVRAGEIVGIAGLEGQGQSDLFLSLYGVRRSEGTIELEGNSVRPHSPAHALDAGIGLVPEDRARDGLCLPLSISENMILSSLSDVSRGGFISGSRVRQRVEQGVEALRIKLNSPNQEVSALSGGNQQKVLLSRVLLRHPRLLLMYDATRGVDVGTKSEIYQLIRAQCDQGVCVLWYSSDIAELVNIADRVAVLHDGAVRALLEGDITEAAVVAAVVGGGGDTEGSL
jgi:ribose transport system ATP-binding protein